MVAVTQRINSYLGGVSKQSDDKMLPGQVRECYNGFPDATYGLTKRPGFKHIVNLGTGTTYDDGKWFYIKRDDDEEYVGVIKGSNINIWNAVSGNACTVTYGTGAQAYLSGAKTNYKIITVQDTSIVINSSVTVTAQAAPTFNAHRVASIEVQYVTSSTTYTVEITINGSTQTASYTTPSSADVNTILTQLESGINGMSGDHAQITVTKLANSLELSSSIAMDIHAEGGLDNKGLTAVEDEVASVGELPVKSVHGRTVKIVNTNSSADTYWAAFKAHDTTYNADGTVNVAGSGEGYWEETRDPGVSPGLDNSTLPHELINTAVDTFTFQKITYEDRLVGDDETNSHPSFIDEKITAGFFHNNRLGFLSKDNVIMSQSGDFYNFYFKSAQTTIDSDPVDISCSSIKPTALHAALPTAQGVVLFSENQQFLMFADAGVLTPALATIRALSNYEMDRNIEPVDSGTNLNFITKTPGYSRVFSMVTRGQQDNPQVLDLSRVVKEWVSPDVDQMISSPQNSMIAMAGQSLNEVFIFRYYSDGKENLMEAWTSWLMPGTVQFIATHSDDMYAVTKQGNQFTLSKAALSQSPEQAIIVNNQGQKVNPSVDLYATASSVVYDSATKTSKCYLPYNDVSTLTPVIVIKGNTSSGTFVESGFTVTPERGSDGTGPFFSIANKDLSGVASDVIVGFKYNFDVELPRTYYRPDPKVTDFTANLTIARMKFSVGLSGMMSFKLQQTGRLPYELEFTGDGSTTTYRFNKRDLDYVDRSDVIVTINGVNETGFSFTDDTTVVFTTAPANNAKIKFFIKDWFSVQPTAEANTYLANDVPLDNENVFTIPIHQRTENFRLKMFNNSPFPVAVNAMMWEGKYTPRFYRRA
jgi:hypothetical protein|tara:strand:- start:1219 stop:3834 length:2616 start_codon:yes stop_codon:yes gene_type:complete